MKGSRAIGPCVAVIGLDESRELSGPSAERGCVLRIRFPSTRFFFFGRLWLGPGFGGPGSISLTSGISAYPLSR